jgi:hypothetical protein
MRLAIKLFMGLKRIGNMLAGLWSWAVKNPAWALLIAVSLIGSLYTWRLSSKLERTEQRLAATQKAFADTIVNYRLAAISFEKKQADNIKRVAAEQEELANEQVEEFKRDSSDWRGRFERLRADRRNQSRTGKTGLPAVPSATGSPTQADSDTGDTSDPEMIEVRIDDLETLVNGVLQGRAIQDLWIANEGVDTDGE